MSDAIDFADLRRRMEGAVSALKHDLAALRILHRLVDAEAAIGEIGSDARAL